MIRHDPHYYVRSVSLDVDMMPEGSAEVAQLLVCPALLLLMDPIDLFDRPLLLCVPGLYEVDPYVDWCGHGSSVFVRSYPQFQQPNESESVSQFTPHFRHTARSMW